jgi:tRNA U34 5-methylaminomethyl-2-thiouridine-forming methyltransferase MnmC
MITLANMAHEIVEVAAGKYSMRPLSDAGLGLGVAEAMHSDIGAWEEAHRVYLDQACLAERLREHGPELVIYDVGMGVAANALAAIECFVTGRPSRDLRVVSFEKHRDALELALAHEARFPWIARHRAAVADLLGQGRWSAVIPGDGGAQATSQVSWELHEGDFRGLDLSGLPRADLVFFDFYSSKTGAALWSARCFGKLRDRAASSAELFTYSTSTAARAAMLLAGWCVGTGHATEHKRETTIAAIDPRRLARPLGLDWLTKLARSSNPFPEDWRDRGDEAVARIRSHEQFNRGPAQ